MKRKVLGFMLVLLMICSVAFASSFDAPAISYDVSVDINFTNDEDLAVLHMHLDVMPNTIELLIPNFELEANTVNNQFILYSYQKSTAIPSGPIMRLNYSNITQNTTFTLGTLGATDAAATALFPIDDITGNIKVYFVQEDVRNTALDTIEAGTDGIDEDGNGIINVIDVQKITNGQQ